MRMDKWWFRRMMVKLLYLLACCIPSVVAGQSSNGDSHSSTIIVDFETRTISPANPTMNIKANSSVVLEIKPSNYDYIVIPSASVLAADATSQLTSLAEKVTTIPRLQSEVTAFVTRLSKNPEAGKSVLTEFNRKVDAAAQGASPQDQETAKEVKKQAEKAAADTEKDVRSGNLVIFNFDEHKRCPGVLIFSEKPPRYPITGKGVRCDDYADKDSTGKSWFVHLADRGARDYAILIKCPEENSNKDFCRAPITVDLHIVSVLYAPSWGAGFSFTSLRDQRYRLDNDPASSNDHLLTRLSNNGPTPAQVAFYLHYCDTKDNLEWFCPLSIGLASDLKEGIQVMAGPGIRFRSIPIVNSAYLVIGPVYGPRKVLSDDYVGRSTAPGTVTTTSLLTTKQGWGGFIGLSLGFLGSQDKFTGVYPGKESAQTAEKADKSKNSGKPDETGKSGEEDKTKEKDDGGKSRDEE